MISVIDLIHKMRSPENQRVLEAVEELRVRGWLADGSLNNVPLCHAHMEGADLMQAALRKADMHQAHLNWADLSMADLSGSDLSRVNMQGANLSQANLSGVDLFKANLQDARNLTDAQLFQARRLYGAIMPNGNTYDGRYGLPGDLDFARWGKVDVNDPQAMAQFLGVSLQAYLQGQEEAKKSKKGAPARRSPTKQSTK